MNDKERILKLVETGQLREALEQTLSLLKYLTQKDIYSTVTQLLAQLNTAESQLKLGQIPREAYNVIENRIRLTFLDVFKPYEPPPSRRKGYLAHNVPNEMTLNNRVECCIKVSDVEEALTRKAGFRLEDTDFHLRQITRVNLEGNSAAFCIEPITKLTDQTILPEEVGSWKFYVTPLLEGTHDLIIRVQGLVPSLLGNEAQIEEDCPIKVSISTRPPSYIATNFKQLPIQVGEVLEEDLYTTIEPPSTMPSPHPVFHRKTAISWALLLGAFVAGAMGYQMFYHEAKIEFFNNCLTVFQNMPVIFINNQQVANEAINYDEKTNMITVKYRPRFDLWLDKMTVIKTQNMFGKDTTFNVHYSGKDLFGFHSPKMDICNSNTGSRDVPQNPVKATIVLNCITPKDAFLAGPTVVIDGQSFIPTSIKPQIWQVTLPDIFKNKQVTVSMVDSAYNCSGQTVKLDSVIETINLDCIFNKVEPPVIGPTFIATETGSVILKTSTPLFKPVVLVYLENNEILKTTEFIQKSKGQSEFEIPDLDLGKIYKFDVRGYIKADSQYRCVTSFLLVHKNKQGINLGCNCIGCMDYVDTTTAKKEIINPKGITSLVVQTSLEFDKANVFIDGSPFGMIHKNGKRYEGDNYSMEGTHKIELKKGNFYCEETVTLAKGEVKVVKMTCLCDISLSKKADFKKTKLSVGSKTINYKKSGNKLLFTLPRQTDMLVFQAEDENEVCKAKGIPLSNKLNLSFSDCEKTTKPYEITFKVDNQLKEVLGYLEVKWEKNGKKASLKKSDVSTQNSDNSITVKVWDKIKKPTTMHSLTLILPHKLKKLQIGQFYGQIRDSIIKCPICVSCMN